MEKDRNRRRQRRRRKRSGDGVTRDRREEADEGRSRRAKSTKGFKDEGDKAGVGVSGKRSKLGGFERFVTRGDCERRSWDGEVGGRRRMGNANIKHGVE